MRAVYKNPKELATCLKDIVDTYDDGLITRDAMESKLLKIIEANRDEVYKEKSMSVRISNVLGEYRTNIINEIVNKNLK